MDLAVVIITLFLASILMGLFGFGFTMVAIPLLSFIWPIRQIIPLLFVYTVMINIILLIQLRSHIRLRRIWPQLGGFVPSVSLGLAALSRFPDAVLKLIIGVTLCGFALWSITKGSSILQKRRVHWGWGVTAGGLSGILGGAVYMPGPPVIVLNTVIHSDRYGFKADLQAFFLIANLCLLLAYQAMGLFSWTLLRLNICMAPFVLLGVWCGAMVCQNVSDGRFKGIANGFLFILALLLITRTLS